MKVQSSILAIKWKHLPNKLNKHTYIIKWEGICLNGGIELVVRLATDIGDRGANTKKEHATHVW